MRLRLDRPWPPNLLPAQVPPRSNSAQLRRGGPYHETHILADRKNYQHGFRNVDLSDLLRPQHTHQRRPSRRAATCPKEARTSSGEPLHWRGQRPREDQEEQGEEGEHLIDKYLLLSLSCTWELHASTGKPILIIAFADVVYLRKTSIPLPCMIHFFLFHWCCQPWL